MNEPRSVAAEFFAACPLCHSGRAREDGPEHTVALESGDDWDAPCNRLRVRKYLHFERMSKLLGFINLVFFWQDPVEKLTTS